MLEREWLEVGGCILAICLTSVQSIGRGVTGEYLIINKPVILTERDSDYPSEHF
jgi:hypothetical protein